jgi:hypothetical protein
MITAAMRASRTHRRAKRVCPEVRLEEVSPGRIVADSETGATARRLECTLSPGAPDY